jgi:uncharacterized protein YegP (UPF0339 family)
MSAHINIEKNRNGQYIWVLVRETEAEPERLAQSAGTYRSIDDAKKAAEEFKQLAPKANVLGVAS